jgi:chromate reductase
MMNKPRIVALSGSLRAGSYNQKVATIAAAAARSAGADVTLISLRDFRLPLFDEDLESEEGMPASASELKKLFLAHNGLIIASPEYNSTLTAALKNAIDWVSRATSQDEAPLLALKGKSAAILSASPGAYGGSRGLAQLRPFLVNIGIYVMPEQVTIPNAYEAFDADGNLVAAAQTKAIESLVGGLITKLKM